MLDYHFASVSRYDGTRRTETAIEVFNSNTGTTLAFCRRVPFESRQAWINRALQRARMVIA
jgi:hypothetical protein